MARTRAFVIKEFLCRIADLDPELERLRLLTVLEFSYALIDLAQSVFTVTVYHSLSRNPDLVLFGHGTEFGSVGDGNHSGSGFHR